jgi:hypothetical protein
LPSNAVFCRALARIRGCYLGPGVLDNRAQPGERVGACDKGIPGELSISSMGSGMESETEESAAAAKELPATAFSLLVYTRQPLSTRLFLKKSRTSLNPTVQSRSENALVVGNAPGLPLFEWLRSTHCSDRGPLFCLCLIAPVDGDATYSATLFLWTQRGGLRGGRIARTTFPLDRASSVVPAKVQNAPRTFRVKKSWIIFASHSPRPAA